MILEKLTVETRTAPGGNLLVVIVADELERRPFHVDPRERE